MVGLVIGGIVYYDFICMGFGIKALFWHQSTKMDIINKSDIVGEHKLAETYDMMMMQNHDHMTRRMIMMHWRNG